MKTTLDRLEKKYIRCLEGRIPQDSAYIFLLVSYENLLAVAKAAKCIKHDTECPRESGCWCGFENLNRSIEDLEKGK